MSLATFDFPYYRQGQKFGDNSRRIKFGSGYEFRTFGNAPVPVTYQLIFPVMKWYLDANGEIDANENGTPGTQEYDINLGRLWNFYDEHQMVKPFNWTPRGRLTASQFRFANVLEVDPGRAGDLGTRLNIRLDLELLV